MDLAILAGMILLAAAPAASAAEELRPDALGNRVPDFSHCGYMGGGVVVPDVAPHVVVSPGEGDAGPRIQAAIDYVSKLAPDAAGVRGAVLLTRGRYPIASCVRIRAGGVVLRGQGAGNDGTVFVATGTDRRSLIQVAGSVDVRPKGTPRKITDDYVPVGARSFHVADAAALRAGDAVRVRRPSTAEWISAIGMYQFPGRPGADFRFTWVPGKMDVVWDRVVTAIEGDLVTVDAPLTTAIDRSLGGGTLSTYAWPGRIAQVGIENLRCESEYDAANPLDEEHAWMTITMENVRDAWVRQVTAVHFASSAVSLWETCSRITVEDCQSLDPVSEVGGYRRHSFFTGGQQTLFLRCHAEHGRRDFAVGYLAAGPNAFVHCDAVDEHDFSGPMESWASGVLYDNVNIDGGALRLDNREICDQGVGWAAANCMLWNCTAPVIVCRKPPGAKNWVMGCWGQFVGDSHWGVVNEFVKPDSLYSQQLQDRLGLEALAATKRRTISAERGDAKPSEQVSSANAGPLPKAALKRLTIQNGWLTCDGKLLAGDRVDVNWWRGHIIPSRAPEYGPNVTRFVPGRTGPGFTDDLDQLTDSMAANGQAVLAQHWGLWYDQRRQDHEMMRRPDADVWPPFYEQPWARSGKGKAWDGLSKYDLTRFNPWYFGRLKQFADLCDRKGLVLLNQMYFQHNIIEAGAHWVDTPWRPANALQDLGFPEPPPFENRKRIFMADAFYDISQPARREFHRAYMRKSLENLADNTNVIQVIGEEFTGPLHFVQFWLDTIAEWQRETGRRVLVGLSCTKDVQDAILGDPVRSQLISVIEMKYWWYTADGGIYDPKGGQSLAPRQQLREWKGPKARSDASISRQIREYRRRFPAKAVICAFDKADGWAILAAGGSIPSVHNAIDSRLLAALPRMEPLDPAPGLVGGLAEVGRDYLIYSPAGHTIRIDLSAARAPFLVRWIEPAGGEIRDGGKVEGGAIREFQRSNHSCVLWLTAN